MFLCLIGALAGQLVLGRLHDSHLERPTREEEKEGVGGSRCSSGRLRLARLGARCRVGVLARHGPPGLQFVGPLAVDQAPSSTWE